MYKAISNVCLGLRSSIEESIRAPMFSQGCKFDPRGGLLCRVFFPLPNLATSLSHNQCLTSALRRFGIYSFLSVIWRHSTTLHTKKRSQCRSRYLTYLSKGRSWSLANANFHVFVNSPPTEVGQSSRARDAVMFCRHM